MQKPSVLATLAGNKTQTRRVIKNVGNEPVVEFIDFEYDVSKKTIDFVIRNDDNSLFAYVIKIEHPVESVRYVKEAYWLAPNNFNWGHDAPFADDRKEAFFDFVANTHPSAFDGLIAAGLKKQSPLFMPECYSRLHIEITGVRVERLQDISDEDIFDEGCVEGFDNGATNKPVFSMDGIKWFVTSKEAYKAYFIKINGSKAWDSNPWVFVYDYKVIWRKEVLENDARI